MKTWTREERYRVLKSKEEIKDLYEKIQTSDYRQQYHIQPITGLSSDPNGFIYHQGTWHLYYQWCPWGAVHGLKYWYHTTSKDLVHWNNEGIGMAPDTIYDNKGVHSGSGFSDGDDLYLFYTGNHRDENWVRTPYTCLAQVDADGKAHKFDQPLFGPHPDFTEHQRDPKVIFDKKSNKYFILLGAQSKELKGTVVVYSSDSLKEGWTYEGPLHVIGYEDFGGMWECPSITHIGDKDVLVFSPQYTTLPGRGPSTNHNVYLIGTMDYETLTFTPEADYRYLDYGFDFYAAQFAANVQSDDKAILTAWIGLPDNHYPTEEEDWEGSLIVPRELTIENNRLMQRPIQELKTLRKESIIIDGTLPRVCELKFDFTSSKDEEIAFFAQENGQGGMRLSYDSKTKSITIDKSQLEHRFNENVGEVLTFVLEEDLRNIQVLIDKSSIEFFFNNGEVTFTSHIYPTKNETKLVCDEDVKIQAWTLQKSVTDTFVV